MTAFEKALQLAKSLRPDATTGEIAEVFRFFDSLGEFDRDRIIAAMSKSTRLHKAALRSLSQQVVTVPTSNVELAARGVVAAWEALPEGNHSPQAVSKWLAETMLPAVNDIRSALGITQERAK